MPIRKDLRKYYYGPQWKAVRTRILKRAGGAFIEGEYQRDAKCEQCGKPDHTWIFRYYWRTRRQWDGSWDYHMVWIEEPGTIAGREWRTERGLPCCLYSAVGLPIKVFNLVGIAHLDHDPSNNSDENLRALCSWCHLMHDRMSHRDSRRNRKDLSRPILNHGLVDANARPG